MSIEDPNVVDFIGTTSEGTVQLTISDHLEWDSEHYLMLQEKLNTYLSFIESNEIYSSYPNANGRTIKIHLMCMHAPTDEALLFISKCSEIIQQTGVKFSYEVSI